MPTVTFYPSKKKAEVSKGTSLFKAARQCDLPVAASCDEEFICGKCNLTVIEGAANLSRQTAPERSLLKRESRPVEDRISCKTYVYGDCTVTAAYWGKGEI